MNWDFEKIKSEIRQDIAAVGDLRELEEFRIKYLGRKGLLQDIYAGLAGASKEDKPLIGKAANEIKGLVSSLLEERKPRLAQAEKEQKAKAGLDLSIPGTPYPKGHKHLITQTIEEVCGIFEKLGFVVWDGPEIESEFNNFTALNIPADHPSRDAFDTFYVETKDPENKDRNLLLRSQTSPVQIRMMQANTPPLAVVSPGKVYRPDAVDASHSFMFHQIEGLLVDTDVKLSDLKGLLSIFCKRLFGDDIKMRFRPHFFPFTEPSAEVDISCYMCKGKGCSVCGRKGWLEIMGCGLVHPKVFEAVNYPKGKYTGLAFGMGVERMAMLKYGIHDIRIFFENDARFLRQF